MDDHTLQELKNVLEQERATLIAELKSIAKPAPHLAGDWNAQFPKFEAEESGSHSSRDEEADEVEEYETRLATEHSLESRLLAVTSALARIQRDSYGKCGRCGKEISLERLHANPAAEFDLEHTA